MSIEPTKEVIDFFSRTFAALEKLQCIGDYEHGPTVASKVHQYRGTLFSISKFGYEGMETYTKDFDRVKILIKKIGDREICYFLLFRPSYPTDWVQLNVFIRNVISKVRPLDVERMLCKWRRNLERCSPHFRELVLRLAGEQGLLVD